MSIGTIENILKRIKVATKDSPIAVFREGDKLDAVFMTTDTIWRIADGCNGYIGAFHKDMNEDKVRNILEGIK